MPHYCGKIMGHLSIMEIINSQKYQTNELKMYRVMHIN